MRADLPHTIYANFAHGFREPMNALVVGTGVGVEVGEQVGNLTEL